MVVVVVVGGGGGGGSAGGSSSSNSSSDHRFGGCDIGSNYSRILPKPVYFCIQITYFRSRLVYDCKILVNLKIFG